MNRFKIAMIAACPFPAPRGTPIRILRMAEELAQRGYKVDVFTYHLGESNEEAAFKIHRIPYIPTYKKRDPGPSYQKLLLLDPLLALKVIRQTRKERYDVIHAHHFEGFLSALPSKRLHGVPLIFDVHTLLESELPSYSMGLPQSLMRPIGRFIDRCLPRSADHVICVSEEIKTHLRERTALPGTRFSTIPNGVEDLFFSCGHERPARTNGRPPRLVYAGNLAPYQGVDLLLEAFAEARQSCPDLRLQILTDACFNGLEAQARALGVRQFIDLENPKLEELPRLLAKASVVANPRTECSGLPQKLVNYMAAGCPIVSFDGSARHIQNGVSGLVVSNGDVSAFSGAVVRLLDEGGLAYELGKNARAYARSTLSWPFAASRIEAVYASLTTTALGAK